MIIHCINDDTINLESLIAVLNPTIDVNNLLSKPEVKQYFETKFQLEEAEIEYLYSFKNTFNAQTTGHYIDKQDIIFFILLISPNYGVRLFQNNNIIN